MESSWVDPRMSWDAKLRSDEVQLESGVWVSTVFVKNAKVSYYAPFLVSLVVLSWRADLNVIYILRVL